MSGPGYTQAPCPHQNHDRFRAINRPPAPLPRVQHVKFQTDPLQGQGFLGRRVAQAVGLGDGLVGDLAASHVAVPPRIRPSTQVAQTAPDREMLSRTQTSKVPASFLHRVLSMLYQRAQERTLAFLRPKASAIARRRLCGVLPMSDHVCPFIGSLVLYEVGQ